MCFHMGCIWIWQCTPQAMQNDSICMICAHESLYDAKLANGSLKIQTDADLSFWHTSCGFETKPAILQFFQILIQLNLFRSISIPNKNLRHLLLYFRNKLSSKISSTGMWIFLKKKLPKKCFILFLTEFFI